MQFDASQERTPSDRQKNVHIEFGPTYLEFVGFGISRSAVVITGSQNRYQLRLLALRLFLLIIY